MVVKENICYQTRQIKTKILDFLILGREKRPVDDVIVNGMNKSNFETKTQTRVTYQKTSAFALAETLCQK
jgi:hypothetical protein